MEINKDRHQLVNKRCMETLEIKKKNRKKLDKIVSLNFNF